MLETAYDSTNFLLRYLWTAFVMVLVIGGLVVALARSEASRPGPALVNHSLLR